VPVLITMQKCLQLFTAANHVSTVGPCSWLLNHWLMASLLPTPAPCQQTQICYWWSQQH
jgi:hypothetical protein